MAIKKKKGSASSDEKATFVNSAAGVVEAGFLMAAADGEVKDEEIETLASVISGLFDGALEEEKIEELLQGLADDLERDGFEKRMAQVAGRLTDDPTREAALRTAAAVLLIDGEIDAESEGGFYLDLADALGIDRERAKDIGDEVEALFTEE